MDNKHLASSVRLETANKLSRTRRRVVFAHAIAVVLWCLLFQSLFFVVDEDDSTAAGAEIKRFIRMGDGQVHIRNVHNNRQANVQLLNPDGSLNEESILSVDKVFGFSQGERGNHVSLRLVFLLDYFSDKMAPGRIIELYSGYRNPRYNQKLRSLGGIVAPTSTHMDALAIDFSIKGVAGKLLWETIRKEECCGVGHYGGNMVHLDSGRPRFWEAATSKVNSGESDFNRRIYLSTQYDRYRPGEDVRLTLSSVSNYSFGVKRTVNIAQEGETDEKGVFTGQIRAGDECVCITDRTVGRSLYVPLSQSLYPGSYRIWLEFCNIPFPGMPAGIASNRIEVVAE